MTQTQTAHVCNGTTFVGIHHGGELTRFECPFCKAHYYPISDINPLARTITWLAGRPNKKLQQIANTPDVVQNLVKIGDSGEPIYEAILYVRTDTF